MIPKIIHYCWFGGNPLSPQIKKYIASWKKYCPDYELRQWDETNFDITCNAYVQEAYEAKKWAFVTDYVRMWALKNYGGLYMDTDVEVLRPLDEFLDTPAFSGFENETMIPTALMGSEKDGQWVSMLLADYDERHFVKPDGTYDLTTNVVTITELTVQHYPIVLDNTYQTIDHVLTIYPNDYFCPKSYATGVITLTENTHVIHHFSGSWLDQKTQRENAVRSKCMALLGKKWGTKLAWGVNLAAKHDGSLWASICYYASPVIGQLFRCLPVGKILVFETEGDFCDNGRALFEYLVAQGYDVKYKLVWIVSDERKFLDRQTKNVRFVFRRSIRGQYYIQRARYFFFTHPYWLTSWKKSQTVIGLWHGIPLKGAGNDLHQTFDYLCVSSKQTFPLYERFMCVQAQQQLEVGSPRRDLLFHPADLGPLLESCGVKVPYQKLVLCMPTFRQTASWTDGTFKNEYSINVIQSPEALERLNAFLQEHQILLVVKIHHLQKLDFLQTVSLTNILYLMDEKLMEQDVQLYELVGAADCLLTDYSSVFYDYLVLNRPIGFFVSDMTAYDRGFVVDDPLAYMPGEKLTTEDDLCCFLQQVCQGEDGYSAQRKALLDQTDKFQDDQNSKRLVEALGL